MKTISKRLQQLERRHAEQVVANDTSGARERLLAVLKRVRERLQADPNWESMPKPTVAEVRQQIQEMLSRHQSEIKYPEERTPSFEKKPPTIVKRILSGSAPAQKWGGGDRKGRAGALRIGEFIERSRNASLWSIKCVFAVSDGEGVERSEGLEDGVLASGARTRDTDGRLETFLQRCDQSRTEIDRGSDQSRGRRRERSPWLRS